VAITELFQSQVGSLHFVSERRDPENPQDSLSFVTSITEKKPRQQV
jgi:hypothetical protein